MNLRKGGIPPVSFLKFLPLLFSLSPLVERQTLLTHSHSLHFPSLIRGPLNQLEGRGSAVSSPSGVGSEAPTENEFGAL